MPIAVSCQCGQRLQVKDELVGKRVKCPKCGQPVAIPDPLSAAAPSSGFDGDDLSQFENDAAFSSPSQAGLPAATSGLQTPFSQAGQGLLAPAAQKPNSQAKQPVSKKKLVILLSSGGAALLVLVVIVLMIVLSGDDGQQAADSNPPDSANAPAQPEKTKPKPDKPKPPAVKRPPLVLAELAAVSLEPGAKAVVELKIDRKGAQGPIQVVVEGLPEGLTVKAPAIGPDDSTGRIEIAASSEMAKVLDQESLQAKLTITAKTADVSVSQPLSVSVSKLALPSFKSLSSVIVPPGTTAELTVEIQRNGYQGPLTFRVEGLPAKVTGTIEPLKADETTSKLKIVAAADAAVGTTNVTAVTSVGSRKIGSPFPLQIDKNPYTVNSLKVVTLKPGDSLQVPIPVVRGSYKGPIQLDTGNVPDGVSITKVVVAPEQTSGTLVISADAGTLEQVRSVHVIATAGHLRRVDPLIVRVSRGESESLPRELLDDPELSKLMRRGGFGGRTSTKSKEILLRYYGGTPQSEAAVMAGLRWLAQHQQIDGRWTLKDYSNQVAGCNCKTAFEGEVTESETAATAFGLLPFLGAGVSPNRSPDSPAVLATYQTNVSNALVFLTKQQDTDKTSKKYGKLDDNMYAHALGTMALCEAYALSGDEALKENAQLAIRYIVNAQHEKGGGWRYAANQAGDLSATGWMFLAIRNGQLSGLQILRAPLQRAERFVDSCGAGPEDAKLSQYSYTPGEAPKLTMTAAGLLTRQYLGWKREKPDLVAGSKFLMQHLPPRYSDKLGTIYYHYYATQVLHHMGGPDFDLWNHLIREHLIRTQRRSGHEAGSWHPEGCDYGARAGRIYATSMALMTLQVYYRHLPMYDPLTSLAE